MNESGTEIRRRFEVHLGNGRAGHRKLREGKQDPKRKYPASPSRLARLLALAHHFDELIRRVEVRNQAEIARLCHVSRARVTQIMNLLFLAPDIQENLLLGIDWRDTHSLTSLRAIGPVLREACWRKQRGLWSRLEDRMRVARGSAPCVPT